MSLATRCSACGTVFRVVQDQLKISEGWVRCGRCEQVFNALEGLFDLERESPPPWSGDGAAAGAPAGSTAVAQTIPTPLDEPDTEVPTVAGEAESTQPVATLPASTLPASGFGGSTLTEERAPARGDVGFLRRAERAAAWRRPGVRATLALLVLLLGGSLTAQALLHWRDAMAARWPAAQPLLLQACGWLDCRIEALRRVESLAVDSSGLTKLDNGGGLYRLSVVLRNRDSVPIHLPALELSLTDGQGRTLARKVIRCAELGAPQEALAAGAELALQGVLDAGEQRLAGYSVEIFYP